MGREHEAKTVQRRIELVPCQNSICERVVPVGIDYCSDACEKYVFEHCFQDLIQHDAFPARAEDEVKVYVGASLNSEDWVEDRLVLRHLPGEIREVRVNRMTGELIVRYSPMNADKSDKSQEISDEDLEKTLGIKIT